MGADVGLCVVLGGGGHARTLIDNLLTNELVQVHGVLDADCTLRGKLLLGVPILGGDELLPELVSKEGVDCFVVGLGGTVDHQRRQNLFELGLACGLEPLTVIHPKAVCSRWTRLGAGCQLGAGALVNAGAELGVNVLTNTGAIVEHDCRVGDHAHVATGATLCGGVHVGERAHVGAGSTVRQGIRVGDNAVVGAGAVVVKDVASNKTVVGVPADVLTKSS